MSRGRFLRLIDAAEYLGCAHPSGPGLDRHLARRRETNPHVRLVNLSCRTEHAAGGKSTRRRRDTDDAVLAVQEGSGGRTRLDAQGPFLCPAADRLPYGPVRATPP